MNYSDPFSDSFFVDFWRHGGYSKGCRRAILKEEKDPRMFGVVNSCFEIEFGLLRSLLLELADARLAGRCFEFDGLITLLTVST